MGFHQLTATGGDALDLVTDLLHRVRLADPTAGLAEAADLQWWWRSPRASDQVPQRFWYDADGPVGAVIVTDWPHTWAVDLFAMPGLEPALVPEMWGHAVDFVGGLTDRTCQVAVGHDDDRLAGLVIGSGLVPTDHEGVLMWMAAGDRQRPTAAPDGYRLLDRGSAGNRPHHMIRRSGEQVAERLAQTSLYRPDLDLFVETGGGEVAAYGLFWHDPVTAVGMVEPMRTEDAHQGQGLGRLVLTEGLDRMASLGATRLKILHEADNPTAAHLYTDVGFRPHSTYRMYTTRVA